MSTHALCTLRMQRLSSATFTASSTARLKSKFKDDVLKKMNDALDIYKFDIAHAARKRASKQISSSRRTTFRSTARAKAASASSRRSSLYATASHALDVLLLEEPENHLSHVHMHKLIDRIRTSEKKQLFIATHSSFIATRLNLKKALILSEEKPSQPASLKISARRPQTSS